MSVYRTSLLCTRGFGVAIGVIGFRTEKCELGLSGFTVPRARSGYLGSGPTHRGRPLARPAKSKVEIERLCTLNPTDRMIAVRREGRHLTLETLAFLVRKALGDRHPELTETAAAHLLERSRPIAESVSWALRLEDRKDVHSEGIRDMFVALQAATSEKPTFWEERFGRAYKQRCLDAIRRRRTKLPEATVSVHDVSEKTSRLDQGDRRWR